MLPELGVATPRARLAAGRVSRALSAGRTLKAPVVCSVSSFRKIRRSGKSSGNDSKGTSGVRCKKGAMRACAARMSARLGACMPDERLMVMAGLARVRGQPVGHAPHAPF